MESLLPHVVCVNSFHQISTRDRHHRSIHSELQLPGAQLRVGVDTGEPKPAMTDKVEFDAKENCSNANNLKDVRFFKRYR